MNERFIAKTIYELTTLELYEILRARADVFTREEKILYPDADGMDYDAVHIYSMNENGRVSSYLRMLPKQGENKTVQLGRVLTVERGVGSGRQLMEFTERYAEEEMNIEEIYIESQDHAVGFYEKLGYRVTSEPFIEAGIPHVEMRKRLIR